MRVLYFSGGFGPHDERFLAALARTRHEVWFLRLQHPREIGQRRRLPSGIREINWAGLTQPLRWIDVPRLTSDLKRTLQHVRPDLVHAGPIHTCAFLTALTGFRPLLTMSWGFDLMQDVDRGPIWRWATRYTLSRSTYFVSDAEVTRDRAIAHGMNPKRTAVFPWGVDLKRFKPERRVARDRREPGALRSARARPGSRAPSHGLVLFCNRSWEPRYGVDTLARAFAKVAPQRADVSLLLLGGGSQADVLRSILAESGCMNRVFIAGHIPADQMHKWYARADVFISPSHVDGSSVSLMEALASGLPALVSDIPANREWVRNGVNGWLFKDGDVDQLADRILWIASQPQARLQRVGEAARATAERRADWSKNFKVLLHAYDQAAALEQSA